MVKKINIVIVLLIAVLAIVAFLLFRPQKQGTFTKNEVGENLANKPPALRELIEPELEKQSEITETTLLPIMYNNEMIIEYIPTADAYGVTIFDSDYEQLAKEGVEKYFKALGVEDFSSLKIDYRIKPKI